MAKSETKKEKKLRKKRRELCNSEDNEIETKPEKKLKRKKRKLSHSDEKDSSKSPPIGDKKEQQDDEIEELNEPNFVKPRTSWNNLNLILSLQNNQLDVQQKIEMAFNYVINSVKINEKEDGNDQLDETLSVSRLILFLNEWVQSQLISTGKKVELDTQKPRAGVGEACLDYRCWEVFKICLQESLSLQIPLKFNVNLLRAFALVVKDALVILDGEENVGLGVSLELYGRVLDCVVLLFSSHGRLINANMDLWASLVILVVDLVCKIYGHHIAGDNLGGILLQFSCLVLEPFANFLRVHPSPKNIFPVFVDKLLEPLLYLLVELHLQMDTSNSPLTGKLLKLIEDILSNGLFHSAHLEGFLSTQSIEKYVEPSDKRGKNRKAVIKSYHRYFFQKLEKIMAENVRALGGVGELFHLFLVRVKKQKGVSLLSDETELERTPGVSEKANNAFLGNTVSASRLDTETNKSAFNLFVRFMEPFMASLKRYVETNLEGESDVLQAHSILKSVNLILSSLMREKIFSRTEDDSEGACFNFLKEVYQTVISLSAKVHLIWLSSFKIKDQVLMKMMPLVAKEIVVSLEYFLEIEYEVAANDLVSLWLIIIVYSSIDLSVVDTPERRFLTSEILHLGCQLIDVYSELRQVDILVFALCKAIRLFGFCDKDNDMDYSRFLECKPFLSSETCVTSLAMFLCSQEFRLGISSAIKSIPEGQTSGCIRQLKMDFSESIEWLKLCCLKDPAISFGKPSLQSCTVSELQLQVAVNADLIGRALSEIYTLILDCSVVTSGNSILVGNSLKDLLTAVRPSLGKLVGKQQDNVGDFLFFVTGRRVSTEKMHGSKHNSQAVGPTTASIFIFFFRLYISCRSLYREVISLMPPESSRKTSATIGDLFTAYSGNEWLGGIDWLDGGYFSWIINPSYSLLSIIKSVSEIYSVESVTDCAPLTYVLHVMALQRLVDLNRQIKAFEFIHERAVQFGGAQLPENRLSDLRKEAVDLTSFLMESLPEVYEGVAWDLSVCTMTQKLLPTAIWWILCHNVDVWGIHATKKELKKFMSCLLHSFLSSSLEDVVNQNLDRLYQLRKVTLHQTSLELLSDTVFHEQPFLRRHLSSRFCQLLEESVLGSFPSKNKVSGQFDKPSLRDDFKSLPHWPDILKELEGWLGNSSKGHDEDYETADVGLNSALSEQRNKLTTCRNLLNLLCWIPKVSTELKSFSVCSKYILHLERIVVFSLLDRRNVHAHYELVRLFVHCRKALKCLIMLFCENTNSGKQHTIPVLSESFDLWLFKSLSAVVEVAHVFSEEHSSRLRYIIFSLMDHTSYVFLTLNKNQCGIAVSLLLNSEMHAISLCVGLNDNYDSDNSDTNTDLGNHDAWEIVIIMAKTLKEQTESLLVSLKANRPDAISRSPFSVGDLNQVSSLVSCIQGYCWGLASVLENLGLKGKKPSKQWLACMSKLNSFIAVYEEFINFCLRLLLVEEHQQLDNLCDSKNFPLSDCKSGSLSVEESHVYSGKKKSQLTNAEFAVNVLSDIDSFEMQQFKKPLLRSLLTGDNPELAISVRQLFIASSAILKLKLYTFCSTELSSVMIFLTSTSQFLLSEYAEMVDKPHPFSFVWLDGVLKYTEVLGSCISITNSTSSSKVYARLINVHLRAIGKCILLQGKRATLASHESESSTKTLSNQAVSSRYTLSHGPYSLNEFKARLQMSFRVLIKKNFELQPLTAVKALESALSGVHEGCNMIYEINIGSPDGGKVSSVVAAGVDCFDLLLEAALGNKLSDIVKVHIQSVVSAMFNIILHLQDPLIFFDKSSWNKVDIGPDPGAVILMCVEVLTKVFGKHVQMDPYHVGQSLRVPGALFRNFLKLSYFQASSTDFAFSADQDSRSAADLCCSVLDRQFSVDLFAACCRLLCSVLRHHKSETAQCIFLLGDSVKVLLHCLETVDADTIGRKDYVAWDVQEAIKSASFLQRIYEEIRKQKEFLGPYCAHFLSNYISLYSGNGPFKTGIRREVDEALKPGVYALIDACSPDDLQQLHTVLGEGPCRSTLATLQRDYKINFQYGGKV